MSPSDVFGPCHWFYEQAPAQLILTSEDLEFLKIYYNRQPQVKEQNDLLPLLLQFTKIQVIRIHAYILLLLLLLLSLSPSGLCRQEGILECCHTITRKGRPWNLKV